MLKIRLKSAAPWIACALLYLSSMNSLAHAKQTFLVKGTVQDALGNRVWGARIELKEIRNWMSIATTSADNGSFRFSRVAGGEYQIAVRREGFVTSFWSISVPLSGHALLKLSLMKESNQALAGPNVSITEPFDMVPLQNIVTVSAKAKDSKGITRMEIYIDGELEASTYSDSIMVLWDSTIVRNGPHTVFAKAYNRAGEASLSETTILFVDNR